MKDFVQTRYMFPERAKVFSVTKRDSLIFKQVLDLLAERDTPESQQQAVQEFVETIRPELKGCVIFCLQYQVSKLEWEIGVSHQSLPMVHFGNEPEKEKLIPPSWRDKPSQL